MSTRAATPRRDVASHRPDTLERLLAAGDEELKAVGHDALTIRGVAARAGVSPATAYTYFASKNHLFAELFWRFLHDDEAGQPRGRTPEARVRGVTRAMGERLAERPHLAAAVTPALLSSDPDVERLRRRIGGEFARRFEAALGPEAAPGVLDALLFAFSGALLQAGMGVFSYRELGDRLDAVVDVILQGRSRSR